MSYKQLTPLVCAALLFAGMYLILIMFLARSLDAASELSDFLQDSEGPIILFCLVSGVLGWVVHHLASESIDTVGPLVWVIISGFCCLSVCAGFLSSLLIAPRVPGSLTELGIACVVTAIGMGVLRSIVKGN